MLGVGSTDCSDKQAGNRPVMFLKMRTPPPLPVQSSGQSQSLRLNSAMMPPPFPDPRRWRQQAIAQRACGTALWSCNPTFAWRMGDTVEKSSCPNIHPEDPDVEVENSIVLEDFENQSVSCNEFEEYDIGLEINEAWRKRFAATIKRKKKKRKDFFNDQRKRCSTEK